MPDDAGGFAYPYPLPRLVPVDFGNEIVDLPAFLKDSKELVAARWIDVPFRGDVGNLGQHLPFGLVSIELDERLVRTELSAFGRGPVDADGEVLDERSAIALAVASISELPCRA